MIARRIAELVAESMAGVLDGFLVSEPPRRAETDEEYRLAVEFDFLGRPDAPPTEEGAAPWEFAGMAPWWPTRGRISGEQWKRAEPPE